MLPFGLTVRARFQLVSGFALGACILLSGCGSEERIAAPVAVDSAGRTVGEVLRAGVNTPSHVEISIERGPALVAMRGNAFTSELGGPIYFATADCSGQAMLGADMFRDDERMPAAVGGDRATLYVGDRETLGARAVASILDDAGQCRAIGSDEGQGVAAETYLAEAALDLLDRYEPPFRVALPE